MKKYKRRFIFTFVCLYIFIFTGGSFANIYDEPFEDVKGDEAYFYYPYDLSRLLRESAIIKTNEEGEIYKLYLYNEEAKLDTIIFPQNGRIIFIRHFQEKKIFLTHVSEKTNFYMVHGEWFSGIVGGDFDNFSLKIKSGAGISDVGQEYYYIHKINDFTTGSIDQLKKAIEKYQKK